MQISMREMDKLSNLWDFHRRDCTNRCMDAKIDYLPGGGIGTVVMVTCGCGKQLDITDYFSW